MSDYLTEYQAWLERPRSRPLPLPMPDWDFFRDGPDPGEYGPPELPDYSAIRDAVYEGNDDA